jgi:hypothetical protein
MIKVIVVCPDCGKEQVIELTTSEYAELRDPNRRHIQVFLARLSADEREAFVTGICAECWDKIFNGTEEE